MIIDPNFFVVKSKIKPMILEDRGSENNFFLDTRNYDKYVETINRTDITLGGEKDKIDIKGYLPATTKELFENYIGGVDEGLVYRELEFFDIAEYDRGSENTVMVIPMTHIDHLWTTSFMQYMQKASTDNLIFVLMNKSFYDKTIEVDRSTLEEALYTEAENTLMKYPDTFKVINLNCYSSISALNILPLFDKSVIYCPMFKKVNDSTINPSLFKENKFDTFNFLEWGLQLSYMDDDLTMGNRVKKGVLNPAAATFGRDELNYSLVDEYYQIFRDGVFSLPTKENVVIVTEEDCLISTDNNQLHLFDKTEVLKDPITKRLHGANYMSIYDTAVYEYVAKVVENCKR